MARWNALEMLNDVFNWTVGDSIADPSGQALVDFFERRDHRKPNANQDSKSSLVQRLVGRPR